MLDDDRPHEAGCFVNVALDRDARDHVAKLDLATLVRKNRNVIRVPLYEGLALLHARAFVLRNHRADDNIITLQLATLGVVDADRAILVQHDPTAVQRLHGAQIVELNFAVILRFDDRLLECLAGRSADVERPHGQLRAGFADRLRSNDADRFAKFHKLSGGKIAPVAHRANAAATFAGEHRTNLQLLDADALQIVRDFFVDELVSFDDFLFLFDRIDNRFATDAADNARGQIDNFFVAFIN